MKFLLILIPLLWISGCSFQTLPTKEYTLNPSQKQSTYPAINKSMKLASPITPSSLASKSIHYQTSSNDLGSYLYSKWSDTPSAMVENTLLLQLQQSNLLTSIAPSYSSAQTDYLLESSLHAFHHRIDQQNNKGLIDISYRLIENQTKKIVATKRFTIESDAMSKDAIGGVQALNESLKHLNEEVILWLNLVLSTH